MFRHPMLGAVLAASLSTAAYAAPHLYQKDQCFTAEQSMTIAKNTAKATSGGVSLVPDKIVPLFLKAWKDQYGTAPEADSVIVVVSDNTPNAAIVFVKDDQACGAFGVPKDELMEILGAMPHSPNTDDPTAAPAAPPTLVPKKKAHPVHPGESQPWDGWI